MKKILIISEMFYPNNVIGALRPTKIAKELSKRGYLVDVFTRYNVDASEYKGKVCNKIIGFEDFPDAKQNNLTQKRNSTEKHNNAFVLELKLLYRQFLLMRECRDMLKQYKKLLQFDDAFKDYDVVFSTFGPISSLWCGFYHKKKFPNVKWICDFRDPMVVEFSPKLLHPYFRYLEKKSCKKADYITTVSNGYLERICPTKYLKKAYMIPNGYDESDFKEAPPTFSVKDKLRFTYVGALYGGKRDLTPLFHAVKELSDSGDVDLTKIEFCYAGQDASVFTSQAEKYSLSECITDKGVLSREACLDLQFASDFLLLSTWNNKKEYGVFPGKFLEYMLIHKPIISIVDGNMANSEVTSVIHEGNFGVSYEAINDKQDFAILKDYIKKSYNAWCETGKVAFSPDADVLNRYNYKTTIKQLEDLING